MRNSTNYSNRSEFPDPATIGDSRRFTTDERARFGDTCFLCSINPDDLYVLLSTRKNVSVLNNENVIHGAIDRGNDRLSNAGAGLSESADILLLLSN